MATYPKRGLGVHNPQNDVLSYASEQMPEGASQTFVAGAPVVITSGLVVEAAAPVTALWGFSQQAGQNTTGAHSKVVPAFRGLLFFANFLATGDAGGDNALAAADLDAAGFELYKAAVGPGSTVIWFVQDDATAKAAKMASLRTDIQLPNVVGSSFGECAVGDVNARVQFTVLDAVRKYDAA